MELPRRTLADLKARYELEPSLDDLYVEGSFDKEIITRLNDKAKESKRVVYSIDTVEIPPDLIRCYDLTTGNKQRVIVLARELATISKSNHICFVDRDLDHWFGELESINRLKWSKHTSIELYFLNEDFLKDILITTAKCKIANWEMFYSSFIETLRLAYCLRLADRALELGIKWVELKKSLSLNNGVIIFDIESYIRKLPSSNSHLKDIEIFIKEVTDWKKTVNGDPRLHIRGHDLIYLVSWAVTASKGLKNFSSEDAISRLFVLLSDYSSEIRSCIYRQNN